MKIIIVSIVIVSIIFSNSAFGQSDSNQESGISTSNEFGTFFIEHQAYEISPLYETDVKVNGTVNYDATSTKVQVVFTFPDGTRDGDLTFLNGDGYFETLYTLNSDSQIGTYYVFISNGAKVIGEMSFDVSKEELSSPFVFSQDVKKVLGPPEIKISTDRPSPVIGETVTFVIEIINLDPSERSFKISAPTKVPIIVDMSVDRPEYDYVLKVRENEGFNAGRMYSFVVTYKNISETFSFTPRAASGDLSIGAPSSSLQFSLDKSNYSVGDNIAVSGKVDQYLSNESVEIRVKSSNGFNVYSVSHKVNPDGTFSAVIPTSQGFWEAGMRYNISVSYLSQVSSPTKTFSYGVVSAPASGGNMPATSGNVPVTPKSSPTQQNPTDQVGLPQVGFPQVSFPQVSLPSNSEIITSLFFIGTLAYLIYRFRKTWIVVNVYKLIRYLMKLIFVRLAGRQKQVYVPINPQPGRQTTTTRQQYTPQSPTSSSTSRTSSSTSRTSSSTSRTSSTSTRQSSKIHHTSSNQPKWPMGPDYIDVIQDPMICFGFDDTQGQNELKNATVQTRKGGILPFAISGGSAIIFKLKIKNKLKAVKCFTRKHDGLDNYDKLTTHLKKNPFSFLIEYNSHNKIMDAKGNQYTILVTDWINGDNLNDYVKKNMNNKNKIIKLAEKFLEVVKEMESINMAHGDLQHGNIMVENDNLKLIDYDGMYIPGLPNQKSVENGLPDYQHPLSKNQFNEKMDRFSVYCIYLSLLAIAYKPNIFTKYNDHPNNLIFKKNDFENPDISDLFRDIESIRNKEIQELLKNFKIICKNNNTNNIPLPIRVS